MAKLVTGKKTRDQGTPAKNAGNESTAATSVAGEEAEMGESFATGAPTDPSALTGAHEGNLWRKFVVGPFGAIPGPDVTQGNRWD